MTTSLATRISALLPSRSLLISEGAGCRVVAERSGDGRTIRIVRETASGFEVLRTERANSAS